MPASVIEVENLGKQYLISHRSSIGGTTLRDFASAEGRPGYFQNESAVYGREGKPCRACGTKIRALRQGQRSTFYCPACQR